MYPMRCAATMRTALDASAATRKRPAASVLPSAAVSKPRVGTLDMSNSPPSASAESVGDGPDRPPAS